MLFKIPGHKILQHTKTKNIVTNFQCVKFKIYIFKTFPYQFKHKNPRNLQISKFLNVGYPKRWFHWPKSINGKSKAREYFIAYWLKSLEFFV